MPKLNSGSNTTRQRGAVLFVALVFLILITLLALTATGTSILQEKMTGGMRNRQLGLMGSESALRGGEAFLLNLNFVGGNQLTQCPPGGGAAGPTGTCAFPPRARPSLQNAGEQDVTLDPVVQTFRTSSSWVDAPLGAPEYSQIVSGLSGDVETASLHAQPRMLVEAVGDGLAASSGGQSEARDGQKYAPGTPFLYRITSRSQGGSGAVIRVTESVYTTDLNIGNAGANPDDTP